jgi:hypothetical protein
MMHGTVNIKWFIVAAQHKNIFSFPYLNGDHLEDPGLDGRIILRWIFRKWDVGIWTGSSWLRIGTGGGHL